MKDEIKVFIASLDTNQQVMAREILKKVYAEGYRTCLYTKGSMYLKRALSDFCKRVF